MKAYFRQCSGLHYLKILSSLPVGKHRLLYAVSRFLGTAQFDSLEI